MAVLMHLRDSGSFDTAVFIKRTNKRMFKNIRSHIPDQYQRSVIKTLLNRSVKVCSIWNILFYAELNRVKQFLINNEMSVHNSTGARIFLDLQKPNRSENNLTSSYGGASEIIKYFYPKSQVATLIFVLICHIWYRPV